MRRAEINVGQAFGRLTAVRRVPNERTTHQRWLCRCSCGTEITTNASSLASGHTQSCGCKRREFFHSRTHGCSRKGMRAYRAWVNMHSRCDSKYHWSNYGSRGITYCERWRNFRNFIADMGEPPSPRHSLDRIDNDGNYEPSNCRWAITKEQGRNKRTNRLLTHNGQTKCLAQWAEDCGLSVLTFTARLNRGWPVSLAIDTPLLNQGRRDLR